MTEIGYSYLLNVARVIVEDNRNPENYRELDNLLRLPGETFVSECLWYLLRLEDLHLGYERGFYVHSLPEATLLGAASVEVTDEELVSTPAGNFDRRIVKGTNVTDRLWIAKGSAAGLRRWKMSMGLKLHSCSRLCLRFYPKLRKHALGQFYKLLRRIHRLPDIGSPDGNFMVPLNGRGEPPELVERNRVGLELLG